MKNRFNVPLVRLFGIIALVAVIGFAMTACKHEDEDSSKPKDELDGTEWQTYGYRYGGKYTFNSPNWTYTAFPPYTSTYSGPHIVGHILFLAVQ